MENEEDQENMDNYQASLKHLRGEKLRKPKKLIMDNKNVQWNCQGVRGKKNELLDFVISNKMDILALQESKLCTNSNFNLSGYNAEQKYGQFNNTPTEELQFTARVPYQSK